MPRDNKYNSLARAPMGIPAYFAFIIKNYPHLLCGAGAVFRRGGGSGAAAAGVHLFMDSNSVIYDAYYGLVRTGDCVINNSTIIQKTIELLEERIAFFPALKTVFIAFDGVAPFAKMMQQRERRWKTAAAAAATAPAAAGWSTIQITPGTEFMHQLSVEIHAHFRGRACGGKPYIISCADERGEGEHKLFRYVRENLRIGGSETVVVYGLDADLIMLSLNHIHLAANIYVFRETTEFSADLLGGGGGAAAAAEKYTALDIAGLAEYIQREVGISPKEYILLCFFLGNDFMPHFPALNLRTSGMDFLLETYAALNKPILQNDEIHWKNLSALVRKISAVERDRIMEEGVIRDRIARRCAALAAEAKTEEEKLLHLPVLRRELEYYICPEEEGWETRYYRVLLDAAVESPDYDERVRAICVRFCEGLEWTYKYYNGFCPNWKWSYGFHYPPLLCDLVKWMPVRSAQLVAADATSFTAVQQLAMVLPPTGACIREEQIVWAYCRYYWESHLHLPAVRVIL